jgi:hypothetical protein
MEDKDAILTPSVMAATMINPDISPSEYMRKEFFFNCVKSFREAIPA